MRKSGSLDGCNSHTFERNSYSFERTLSIQQGLPLQLHPLAVERIINHFVNVNKDSKIPGVETDSLTAEYFCRLRLCHLSFFALCKYSAPLLDTVFTFTTLTLWHMLTYVTKAIPVLARSAWMPSTPCFGVFSFASFLRGIETLPGEDGFTTILLLFFFQVWVIRGRQRLDWAHKKTQNMQSVLQELPCFHPLPYSKLIWKLCVINFLKIGKDDA